MKSTKFVTACYIMSFVGAHQPQMLSTATVAKWVDTHAARARQIVSLLVKAGLLESARGGSGGILLKRSADQITLLDIYDAVGDTESLFFSVENPFSAWADHCSVHDVLSGLRAELEEQARAALAKIKLSDVFVPWDEDAMRKARSKRSRKAATV
ncbi:Rrf2 family transcriptional regulator [Burkholderia multivorans]|uniref:Transcriptional regulator family protein n=1 Tax=Burkholderia cenocepacia TaxID=95486 RepID=A0AAN0RMT7_9BURK|nr:MULTISPECIES: Rrf2 family transcriptional regulator [Burkholderia cepacia complex]AIO30630.1 transcriptional regulator family protein [Burkholderia cenocepacia]KWF05228.1 Rrf2 family transcriptional regulator [Burkholderia pseudomultivorans]MBU9133304.1 Rrf2 family transcriptional regulator [Burkholderia multivorans]MBU9282890.1 Rrf2 family transcriptional regulator [Burkholderia multivorans]MCO8626388.1 Rrf2 family transcriptional regulator [Burkholderia multivorans]